MCSAVAGGSSDVQVANITRSFSAEADAALGDPADLALLAAGGCKTGGTVSGALTNRFR